MMKHLCTVLLAACLCIAPLAGQQTAPSATAGIVVVRDARTGNPIGDVLVESAHGVAVTTGADGRVRVSAPAGERMTVSRLGYVSRVFTWPAAAGIVEQRLEPSPLQLESLEIRSRVLGAGEAIQPVTVIGSAQLAERMAASIAAVIDAEPGVTARTNGPVAAQPVIRGLGGDRVLVLEDGMRTGDIATTAPDHAVSIEPATAQRIEVIRGPSGLLYGSNTLGGVVNVHREDVPRQLAGGVTWNAALHGESVNRGVGAAARVQGSAGRLAAQIDGSGRAAGDTRTPGGVTLPFTDLEGFDAGAGASWITNTGHVGAAVREYRTNYGVPSSFDGATLPGAHDGGVYVDARRTSARFDGEWRARSAGVVEAVSIGGNAVRYDHAEFERDGFVGTRFGQLARSVEGVVRMRRGNHRIAAGATLHWRDLRASGSYTGTRPAQHLNHAVFAVHEFTRRTTTVVTGVRYDRATTQPLDSTETLLLRDVRTRRFDAITGAAGLRRQIGGDWSLGVQVARAFRPPSIEELFSAGPHLASYAYEVGNPDLRPERGTGIDAVLRREGTRARVELTGYAMRVRDYVTFEPQIDSLSGLPMRDPRLRRYVVYRPQQADAVLSGLEARVSLVPSPSWLIDVTADLPRGSTADGTPLPYMPAASARTHVRRIGGGWTAGVTLDARMARTRVPPAPAGDATCEVVVVDGEATALPAEYCRAPGALLVGGVFTVRLPRVATVPATLTLTGDNLLDARWRDPLWRAGLVAPQPGRNIRIAVQVNP